MVLDIYSKALILVNFSVLLFLQRYFDVQLMLVPFGILLVLQWIWIYKLLEPRGFTIPAVISFVSAGALYIPNISIRILGLAVVIPAIAVAMRHLIKPENNKGAKNPARI